MARRIRWQILIAATGSLTIVVLLGALAWSTAASSLPYYRSAYVEAVVGTPQQLNPLLQKAGSPASERDLAALLFSGLTRPGPDGTPEAELAERWTVDASGRVYTFTLRSGLRWHDGVALTAEDVVFTVRSVQSRAFPGEQRLAAFWRTVEVEQVDRRRIRFTLPAPYAPF